MPDYEEIYGGDFLAAKDLKSKLEAEITQIDLQDFGDSQKLIATLKGVDKKLVLNKTNAKRVAGIANTNDYTQWPGTKIMLYKIVTTFGKEEVDAIRVKPFESPDNLGDI